jgi:dihydrofolate synthase/folylpolyglutamate synthase
MRSISNFQEAHAALAPFVPASTEIEGYTLDVIKEFLAAIGNPQNRLKVLHIAGTSGKTSTAYFTAALLHEAGHHVGLTISPQIDEINERTQLDMRVLPEAEYCYELGLFLDLVDEHQAKLSHFEVLVAFAYWLFDKRKVEYAVVEVGLGGLLDGTNVATRQDKVCVITDIGLDHTKILGNTLSKIAYQKAGIIHAHNAVFMNKQATVIEKVIKATTEKNNGHLTVLEPNTNTLAVNLPMFQKRNFTLAYHVVQHTLARDGHNGLQLDEVSIASQVYIPGRMELISYADKTIVLDGSHNEQKISALVESIKEQFTEEEIALLVSFGSNKISSVIESLKLLRTLGSSIIITEFDGFQDELRTPIDADILAEYAKDVGFRDIQIEKNAVNAVELLKKDEHSIVLITGSFYLLHQIRSILFPH